KYVAEILRKFGLTDRKSASTPIDTEKPLLKDSDGEDVVLSGMESLKRMLHVSNILSAGYLTTQQMVLNSPCLTHIKNWLVQIKRSLSWLVQKQTTLGKDKANSLIVDSLLKTIWSSIHQLLINEVLTILGQTTTGVNTPRSDEDRLELMELTVFLLPSDEKVRVEVNVVDLQVSAVRLNLLLLVQQFLLFGLTNWCCSLSAVSSIKYALTVNLNIYVSCIKQFWTTVAVKKVKDVIRLQALVDKKKVVVTEATIRDALYLDDAEGVECLPNEEIFAELARIGYEKPSTKLTFYTAFFSSQWKFLIHTILQCISVKRTSWNEFSSLMASAVICLSSGDLSTHTTKYTSPALTQKVFANMRRVGKGFSRVETPLFEGMLVAQEVEEGDAADENVENVNAGDTAKGDVSAAHDEVLTVQPPSPQPQPPPTQDAEIPINLLQEVINTCTALTRRVEQLELDKIAQALEITKLKRKRINTYDDTVMDDVSNQGRMISKMDVDVDVVLEEAKEVGADNAKDDQDINVQVNADIQGRKVESQAEIYKIDLDHANKVLSMQEEESEPVELQEVVMDYFKGMYYDDIRPIFERYFDSNVAFLQKTKEQIEEEESRALKMINETLIEKAAKRQKLDEKVEELKRHLHIVPNEDDDVYTEATPLARKLIFLVEMKYPLTRFTLDQMLNVVRLKVKEESEVSLELLSFGVDAAKEFKKNMLSD
nr:hypothetical protein [Tanacetum cinerariifolium]